MLVYKPKQHSK